MFETENAYQRPRSTAIDKMLTSTLRQVAFDRKKNNTNSIIISTSAPTFCLETFHCADGYF